MAASALDAARLAVLSEVDYTSSLQEQGVCLKGFSSFPDWLFMNFVEHPGALWLATGQVLPLAPKGRLPLLPTGSNSSSQIR